VTLFTKPLEFFRRRAFMWTWALYGTTYLGEMHRVCRVYQVPEKGGPVLQLQANLANAEAAVETNFSSNVCWPS
jgi:hypothetical protein